MGLICRCTKRKTIVVKITIISWEERVLIGIVLQTIRLLIAAIPQLILTTTTIRLQTILKTTTLSQVITHHLTPKLINPPIPHHNQQIQTPPTPLSSICVTFYPYSTTPHYKTIPISQTNLSSNPLLHRLSSIS